MGVENSINNYSTVNKNSDLELFDFVQDDLQRLAIQCDMDTMSLDEWMDGWMDNPPYNIVKQ